MMSISYIYERNLQASAQVLANSAYHFNGQLVDVSDWRREKQEVTRNFDIFWCMPVGFAECHGHNRYKWFKGDVDPMSTAQPDGMLLSPSSDHLLTVLVTDDWLYVMPENLDPELVAQACISEQQYVEYCSDPILLSDG